jgi:tRNA uridine 5-carboxymethylaminomethyl modification enzyme
VNGFSTSLPEEIQYEALKKVAGFENVKMFRPGYAIEYDYFPPEQLQLTLETKLVENLYFAGQINGTTGYEEAAGQGLMAGINAHLKIRGEAPFILSRSEAYIGVLIDDLVTKGTEEPYRMFTSRAEYRILLRQDNADFRLTERSFNIGLAKKDRLDAVKEKYMRVDEAVKHLKNASADPNELNPYLEAQQSPGVTQKVKYSGIVARPQVSLIAMKNALPSLKDHFEERNIDDNDLTLAEIQMKYEMPYHDCLDYLNHT